MRPWFLMMGSRWKFTSLSSSPPAPSSRTFSRRTRAAKPWCTGEESGLSISYFLYSGEANIDQKSLDTFLDLAVELELKGLRKTSVNDTKQKICRETNKPEKESDQSLAKGNGNNTILDQSKAMNNDATVVTNKDNTDKTDLLDLNRGLNRWWALVKVLPLARGIILD